MAATQFAYLPLPPHPPKLPTHPLFSTVTVLSCFSPPLCSSVSHRGFNNLLPIILSDWESKALILYEGVQRLFHSAAMDSSNFLLRRCHVRWRLFSTQGQQSGAMQSVEKRLSSISDISAREAGRVK